MLSEKLNQLAEDRKTTLKKDMELARLYVSQYVDTISLTTHDILELKKLLSYTDPLVLIVRLLRNIVDTDTDIPRTIMMVKLIEQEWMDGEGYLNDTMILELMAVDEMRKGFSLIQHPQTEEQGHIHLEQGTEYSALRIRIIQAKMSIMLHEKLQQRRQL